MEKTIIGIIGLGYIGLPIAISFSKKFEVVGFDINKNRINSLNKGIDLNKVKGSGPLGRIVKEDVLN